MDDKAGRQDWTHLLGIIEFEGGDLSAASKELLGKGRELADQLGVWMMAYSTMPPSDPSNQVIAYGADILFEAEFPESMLDAASPQYLSKQADLLSQMVGQERPEIILFTASPQSTALAARVAQRFRTGLATECVSLALDPAERRLLATSSLDDGKFLREFYWPTRRPQMATLKGGIFPEAFPDPYREGSTKKIRIAH